MRYALLVLLLSLSACTSAPFESVEMEVPPWGWTEVSADLPESFPALHRSVVATTEEARELHLAVETDATGTTRAVFVTVYERPSVWDRLVRRVTVGDVPYTANVMETTTSARVAPSSLGLSEALMGEVEAAYTLDDVDRGETGVAVRRCWDDLCAEAIASGADEGLAGSEAHHADLLAALTIRR